VDRRMAEKLYDSGKEPTVAKLLEYDTENERLKSKIAQLGRIQRILPSLHPPIIPRIRINSQIQTITRRINVDLGVNPAIGERTGN